MSVLTDAQALVSSNTQSFPALLDVFSRLECELNQLQPTTQKPEARAAALATVDQDLGAAKVSSFLCSRAATCSSQSLTSLRRSSLASSTSSRSRSGPVRARHSSARSTSRMYA